MPAAIHPYLNFPGTAREAMAFYGRALGAEPQFATFSQFGAVPEDSEHAQKVMHSSVEVTDLISLYGADHIEGMAPEGFTEGTNVSLAIMGDDEECMRAVFERLAEGGTVTMPLDQQVWGGIFGALTDRFGIRWMVNIDPS